MKKSISTVFLALLLGGCAGSTMYIQSDIPIIAEVVGKTAVDLHGKTSYCREAQYEERIVEVRGYNGMLRTTIVHTCVK